MADKAEEKAMPFWWRRRPSDGNETCTTAERPGDLCPNCAHGRLAYDSLFVLVCPACGYVAAGGTFT